MSGVREVTEMQDKLLLCLTKFDFRWEDNEWVGNENLELCQTLIKINCSVCH